MQVIELHSICVLLRSVFWIVSAFYPEQPLMGFML
jgi:hypothetical protein